MIKEAEEEARTGIPTGNARTQPLCLHGTGKRKRAKEQMLLRRERDKTTLLARENKIIIPSKD